MGFVNIRQFCELHKKRLSGDRRVLNVLSVSDIGERIEKLQEALKFLEKNFSSADRVVGILVSAFREYIQSRYGSAEFKKESGLRRKRAMRGIADILYLETPLHCFDDRRSYFIIKSNEKKVLQDIKKRLESPFVVDYVAQKYTRTLRPRGARKHAVRDFLLPYEKEVDVLLKSKGFKTEERTNLIADLFYGIGLERRYDSAREIRRALGKSAGSRL